MKKLPLTNLKRKRAERGQRWPSPYRRRHSTVTTRPGEADRLYGHAGSPGVVASVDIRGGAPGTLETALLSPYASVAEIHAVLLTGGSAPGLAAAAGVTAFLQEGGHGYQTPFAKIPLVAAAVIYDLGLGSAEACPRAREAYQASASAGPAVEEGSVGVGTGATVGKLLGFEGSMKGGVGLASLEIGGGVTVSALTVVNALGDVLDERGEILAGARRGVWFAGSRASLLAMTAAPVFGAIESTTLAVVMTDASLDKLQCGVVARMAHDGMARGIDPVQRPRRGLRAVMTMASGRAMFRRWVGRRRGRGETPAGGAGRPSLGEPRCRLARRPRWPVAPEGRQRRVARHRRGDPRLMANITASAPPSASVASRPGARGDGRLVPRWALFTRAPSVIRRARRERRCRSVYLRQSSAVRREGLDTYPGT
jgi:L-aminopeptidase/D-esterase-like protein